MGKVEEELENEELGVGCVSFGISLKHKSRDVNKVIKYVSLDQWFSNLNRHQKNPEGLVKQITGPTPKSF